MAQTPSQKVVFKKKIQSFLAIFNLQDPPPPALEEGKVLRENCFIFKEVAIA